MMTVVQLHLVLGPPGSGKAGQAVARVREAAAASDDVFLCVPGAADRARFLRELGGGEVRSLLGVEVGTFEQLIERVAGSPPVRRTDRAMERVVVRDALRSVPRFAAAARWSGFVDTARRRVDRLRSARVWGGAELERVEEELAGDGIDAWRALEQGVDSLLAERHLRDDAWFERRAAAELRRGTPHVGVVVIYGFDTLSSSQLDLVERLARHVPVHVSLAWRPGRRVHERSADLRDRWRAMGAFVEELEPVPSGHPLLDWLGAELFEDSPAAAPAVCDAVDAPAPVAFVECSGMLQEVDEVVREVALLAGRGHAWDDIAVASCDARRTGELLLAGFARAGIPARLQARRTAVDVPAGRALYELLDAVVQRDDLQLVAALRAPMFGCSAQQVDAAELAIRSHRHTPGHAVAHAAMRRVVPETVGALLDGQRGTSVVELVRAVFESLLPSDIGELDLLRGLAVQLEGIVTAAGGTDGIGLADIRDAVATFPLAVPDRSDAGMVVISSIEDLRTVAYDAVVIHGLHQSAFRAAVDDDAEAPAAGRDLLHLAVTRTRRTLRAVRQAAGADGGHLAPSPAWQELRRLVPDAPLRVRRLGDVVVEPEGVRLAAEQAPAVAVATGRGFEVDDVPGVVAARVDRLRGPIRSTQLTGPIADELAALRQVSVTAVERYAVCSAQWFVDRLLRISDPDDDRSRLVEGELAHALLQRLVPEARTGRLDAAATRTRADELTPGLAAKIDKHGILDPARIERIAEHVLALIEAESAWQLADVVEVERSFGSEAADSIGPGYVVDGVEVVGRIDRIDRHGSYAILHDYKYSASDRSAKDLIDKRHLQLLVYWLAMDQPGALVQPVGAVYRAVTNGGKPSGVLSEQLRDLGMISQGTRAGVLDEGQRGVLLEDAARLVGDAVDGMRSGHVEPLADPADCPTFCRLQTICRVGSVHATSGGGAA